MQVVDYEGFSSGGEFEGDLDLNLWDESENFVAQSFSITEFEEITIPTSGLYYIEPFAFSGASKYVIKILSPLVSSTSTHPHHNIHHFDFVPNEAVVKFKQVDSFKTLHQKSAAFSKTSNESTSRPALITLDPEANQTVQKSSASSAPQRALTRAEDEFVTRTPSWLKS